VLRPDGQPAEGAEIEAALAASEPLRVLASGPEVAAHSAWAHAGEDGAFAISGLFPGLYDIIASHESGHADLRVRAGASGVAVILREGLSIQGTVTFPDGAPAPFVSVRALGTGRRGGEVSGLTNQAGAFRIGPLDPGVYDLLAAGHAIQDAAAEAVRAGGDPVEIVAAEAILLRGRALFPDGNPAGQAIAVAVVPAAAGLVERARGSTTRRTTTDPEGRFEVSCPWPGPYRVATEASPPYAPAAVEPVDPAAGEVVIRLVEASILEVTVQEVETGRDLAEAEVRVLVPPRDVRVGKGPAPRFVFEESGVATVEARAPGHFAARQEATLSPREPARVAFVLEPSGWLSGAVRAVDGAPVEGARVSLATQIGPGFLVEGEVQRAVHAGLFGGPAWTDASGTFRLSLEKARAGCDYGLAVEHPDVFLDDTIAVEIADPAKDVTGVEITVRPSGRIAGTVRDRGGPVPGAVVICRAEGAAYHSEAAVGPDGRFEIGGLSPGAFALKVEAPGRAPSWIGPVDVAAGATARADAVLEPEASIEGRVAGPDGRPIAGALIAAEWRTGEWKNASRTRSDREGRWRLGALEPGTYAIRVERSGFTTVLRGDVEANGPPVDLVLAPVSRVEGRVTDLRTGLPVEKFTVRLIPDRADLEIHDGLAPRAFAVDDGAYVVEGVPAGPYRLIVAASGYLEHESALEVPVGEAAARDVALDAGSAVLGVVLGPEGRPLEGAEVTVVPLGGPAALAGARPRGGSGTTDAAGRFRVAGLEAGEHRLVARHPACGERTVEPVAVRPAGDGPPAEVEVRLEAVQPRR
jgi:hypothetical protein